MSSTFASQRPAFAAYAANPRSSVTVLNNNANNNPRSDGWAGV